jgi:ribulose-phosphate 3-epimerase
LKKKSRQAIPTGSLFQKAATPHPGTDAARSCFPGASDPLAPSYAEPAGAVTGLSFGGSRPPSAKSKRKEGFLMIKIAPSILSADFANLERDIHRISAADYVHVDVMDGMFVPNISIGIPVLQSIRKVTDMFLDVHLMIVEPVRYVDQFCDAGADLVTVHVESDTEENIHAAIDKIHAKGKKAGVVLKPKTPAEAVLPFIEKVELILVMTVEPGFGGQSFMADQMPKVAAIRKLIDEKNPACELEVDGGVAPDTCKVCIEAGANVLVAGSAVYKAADIPARIAELRG